jgi:hypothetical protein
LEKLGQLVQLENPLGQLEKRKGLENFVTVIKKEILYFFPRFPYWPFYFFLALHFVSTQLG